MTPRDEVHMHLSGSSDAVPNQPATPNRAIRIPDELWEAALRKAQDEGTTVTEVVLKALQRFLRD